MRKIGLLFTFLLLCFLTYSQENKEQISFFATYGSMTEADCVDDDFSQTIFFAVPESYSGLFFLRVLDPDCGGEHDMASGLWETNTVFELYGGLGCLSDIDARKVQPEGNYKAGSKLYRQIFARESVLDGKWIAIGPFSVNQGEKVKEYPGYSFFKLIVEGSTGNDVNLYSLSLSSSQGTNSSIPNTVFFEFEKTYLDGESLAIMHFEDDHASSERISIPVSLASMDENPNFKISAEPIEE